MEKPIEIDTVSGMDVEIDNDFLNTLLKSAIAGTGVPANYIEDIAQVDYARTLAMQNQGFVRNIVIYQSDFGEYYSEIIRKLYYNEFMDKKDKFSKHEKSNNKKSDEISNEYVNLDEIYIKFPPPIYLNLTTVNDQIGNASSTIDFLVNLYFPESSEDPDIDKKKLEFKKNIISKYFLPTMDWTMYDETYKDVELKIAQESLENQKPKDENSEGDEDSGDYDY